MKLALCQLDAAFEDKAATKRRIAALLGRLRRGPLDWLVFPEMTLTSFSMKPRATTLSAEDMGFFAAIARERSAAVSFGGVRGGRNLLITLDKKGREISSYAKTHLFKLLKEEKSYKAGKKTETFRLGKARVSPTVCFDLRFSYLYWNLARKTDVFLNIACWPAVRAEHWTTLLRARAIDNICWAVGVNRAGRDPDFEYAGRSAVYDPMGVKVLDCGSKPGIFTADIAVETVAEARRKLRFLEDRKPWPPRQLRACRPNKAFQPGP